MSHEELFTLFSKDLFIPELKAKNRDGVLEEMVDQAVEAGVIRDRDVILGMLKNRESLGSTGLGEGVAFPHGRSLAIPTLMALFARSSKGIDYGAIDGKPVKLFFMFIAPPIEKENRYLPALGQVVELIRDETSREELMGVKTFEDFQKIILGGE
ncbi:MAG: PTS sugar transporter subunit IIA [bacterium]|nr:PTS sugar transporter subunit IIA [bacterium]